MAAPLRTFIALEIPDGVRAAAAKLMQRLKASGAKVTWTAPENLHVTLKFLGEVDVTSIAHVCSAVQRAAAPLSPFRVSLQGAGAFPEISRPRVLWLGVDEGKDPLIELHARIEEQLAELSYPFDGRRYTPHVTLGRVRGPNEVLAEQLALESQLAVGDMYVEEVLIYSSELTQDGPLYTPLGRAPLDGA